MEVHVLLHDAAARLVRSALTGARVTSSKSALAFARALEREGVDVAIVDPSVDIDATTNRIGRHPLIRSLGVASAPPFVMYLSDRRAPIALRAALIQIGPAMIAVRGVDDSPDQLRAIVTQAIACGLPDDLLSLIGHHLALLRPRIRDALSYALRSPLECDSVETLASVAGISSRVMRHEMSRLGIAGPRHWLAAARVLRAHWELRDPAIKIRHLIAIMGYSGEGPLASDVAHVAQKTPSELRLVSGGDLVNLIARRLIIDPTIPIKLAAGAAPARFA